ncbi:hypothetical protein [Streptomyces hawaiiensis]|uniref:hypothetical protein n=1 Tax=Streptomyces hawaiiensis TaxID=67305 RepID=UPI0015869F24|nr:hypothetical protein [Streptomyces hawaiiensis]
MNSLLVITRERRLSVGDGAAGHKVGRAVHCAVARAVIGGDVVAVRGADPGEPGRLQPCLLLQSACPDTRGVVVGAGGPAGQSSPVVRIVAELGLNLGPQVVDGDLGAKPTALVAVEVAVGFGQAAVGVGADGVAGGERDRQFSPAGPEQHLLQGRRSGGAAKLHAPVHEHLLRGFEQARSILAQRGRSAGLLQVLRRSVIGRGS